MSYNSKQSAFPVGCSVRAGGANFPVGCHQAAVEEEGTINIRAPVRPEMVKTRQVDQWK